MIINWSMANSGKRSKVKGVGHKEGRALEASLDESSKLKAPHPLFLWRTQRRKRYL